MIGFERVDRNRRTVKGHRLAQKQEDLFLLVMISGTKRVSDLTSTTVSPVYVYLYMFIRIYVPPPSW